MIASFIVLFFYHLIKQINLAVRCALWKLKLVLIAVLHMSKDYWPMQGERDVMHFFFLSSHEMNTVSEVVSGLSGLTKASYWHRKEGSRRWQQAYWLPFHALFMEAFLNFRCYTELLSLWLAGRKAHYRFWFPPLYMSLKAWKQPFLVLLEVTPHNLLSRFPKTVKNALEASTANRNN